MINRILSIGLFILLTLASSYRCLASSLDLPGQYSSRVNTSVDTMITYPAAVKFQSICCGVPSDAPLQKAIKQFKKKYRIKLIEAVHIGPLGREGEYDLAFPMTKFTKAQKKAFINMLAASVKKMTNKGKASLEQNIKYDSTSLPSRVVMEPVGF